MISLEQAAAFASICNNTEKYPTTKGTLVEPAPEVPAE